MATCTYKKPAHSLCREKCIPSHRRWYEHKLIVVLQNYTSGNNGANWVKKQKGLQEGYTELTASKKSNCVYTVYCRQSITMCLPAMPVVSLIICTFTLSPAILSNSGTATVLLYFNHLYYVYRLITNTNIKTQTQFSFLQSLFTEVVTITNNTSKSTDYFLILL